MFSQAATGCWVQASRSVVAQHAQRVQQLSAEATSNSKNDIMDRLKESDARLADIKAQVRGCGHVSDSDRVSRLGSTLPEADPQGHI